MKHALLTLSLSLLALLPGGLAWAAPEGGYEPYTAPDRAGDPSVPIYVLLAYSAIWVVVLLFVLSVWRRQRQVEREMRALLAELGGDR